MPRLVEVAEWTELKRKKREELNEKLLGAGLDGNSNFYGRFRALSLAFEVLGSAQIVPIGVLFTHEFPGPSGRRLIDIGFAEDPRALAVVNALRKESSTDVPELALKLPVWIKNSALAFSWLRGQGSGYNVLAYLSGSRSDVTRQNVYYYTARGLLHTGA